MSENNKTLNNFQVIKPVYQRSDIMDTPDGMVISVGAKLYKAYPTAVSAPIYIVDTKNIIHSKKSSLPLIDVDIKTLDEIFELRERDYILTRLHDPRIKEWDDLSLYTFGTMFQFNDATLSKWVDIGTGKVTEDWTKLVSDILQYNCEKDESLVLVNKASIPRGYVMRYQPHTLMITPPNTGKSTFYYLAGKLIDKAKKNTLLGSAKWTDDKAYGLFHEQYFPLAIDQIESQTIENMAGFLLGFLESGKGTVAGGGAELNVTGACPFVVTANPLALQGTNIVVLRDILSFLCRNSYAMGRRFGVLAYGNYKSLVDKGYDDVEHRKLIDAFRALEERVTETLRKFWFHPKIRDFCNTPVYDRSLYEEINSCETIEVRSFFLAHYAHSFPHLRGGALNCALVDNLPRLALLDILFVGDLDKFVDEMIEEAKPYVEQLKAVNLASIKYGLA